MTGKPNRKLPKDLKSLARAYTELAIDTLSGIAQSGTNEGARVTAANSLLARGWGNPETIHTGPGGEDIKVTIRTIVEGVKKK